MARYFLTTLQIEGFRGINNEGDPLTLQFKADAVNSIFAPNGLCKSSVFEALTYAIRGSISKLDDLPASEDADAYYVNRFHSAGTACIVLTLRPDDGSGDVIIRVQRSAKGIRTVDSPSGHPDPEQVLRTLDGEPTLLDHNTFVRFVEETPLKRGRTFSALLGFGKLSELRQALEMLAHTRNVRTDLETETLEYKLQTEQRRMSEALAEIRAAYRDLLGKELGTEDIGAVGQEAMEALHGVALVKPFITGKALKDIDFEAVRGEVRKAEWGDNRARLSGVLRSLQDLESLKGSADEMMEAEKLRAAVGERDEATSKTRGLEFHRLYRTVSEIYDSGTWTDARQCPACESQLEESLPDRVRMHLDEYEEVGRAQKRIQELWSASAWVRRGKSLEAGTELAIPAKDKVFARYDTLFTRENPSREDVANAVAAVAKLDVTRKHAATTLQEERESIEKELPPSLVALTEQIEHAERLKRGIVQYETAVGGEKKIGKRLEKRKAWCEFVESASRRFAEAEVAFSTAKTMAIDSEYRELYGQITNNPDVVPSLRKAAGSEELHLRLEKFFGLADLSATTLLQESYRNALAIAIFLSGAQQTQTQARFMVLDDITSSFDAGHQYGLMELLRSRVGHPANPNGPQIILLSHDGLLEKYFDIQASEGAWHHQRLQGMPPMGSVLIQAQDANRLGTEARKFLSAGQTQQAVPLIRQYLEFWLLEIIRKTRINVPLDFVIRDDKKMVASCLAAIEVSTELHKKAGDLILDAKQLKELEGVYVPALIANWVSHYSTGVVTSITPYVLLGVLDTIDKFVECFKYSCKCKAPTRRFYKNLTEKACGC
jgi:hypothetical protein